MDEDGDSWLQVTRRLPILPTLLTTLEVSLRMKQNLHFTEAAFHLLLTLARTQQVGKPKGGGGLPCLFWAGSGTDSPRISHPPESSPCPWVGGRAAVGTGCISFHVPPS